MKIPVLSKLNTVRIIANGAIASKSFADGRIVPVLVVDCENNKELLQLIQMHEDTPPGDVSSIWGKKMFSSRYVFLKLEFLQPMKVLATLKFDLEKQADLVDMIIFARGFFLQPRESGDSVSEGINKPKISIEIPDGTTFPVNWDKLYKSKVVKKFRKKGFLKMEAKAMADEYISRMRDVWLKRI